MEFTATSITSSSHIGTDEAVTAKFDPVPATPHLRFEGTGRGYVLLDVMPDRLRADLRVVDSIISPTSPVWTSASFVTEPDRPGLQQA